MMSGERDRCSYGIQSQEAEREMNAGVQLAFSLFSLGPLPKEYGTYTWGGSSHFNLA